MIRDESNTTSGSSLKNEKSNKADRPLKEMLQSSVSYDARKTSPISFLEDNYMDIFPSNWCKGRVFHRSLFTSVYFVVDVLNPECELYVIKETYRPQLNKRSQEETFNNEISALKKLGEHERILPIIGYQITKSFASLVFPYMPMKTLNHSIPVSEDQCLLFTRQILEGLDYIHGNSIIHRDIKCSNIFMENDFKIRIGGFGTSKIVCDIKGEVTNEMEKGSWRWMAPEVCNDELSNGGYNYKCDIWSLGCTIMEMVTGEVPYSSFSSTVSVMLKVGNGVPPEIPASISECVRLLLQETFVTSPLLRKSAKSLLDLNYKSLGTADTCTGYFSAAPESASVYFTSLGNPSEMKMFDIYIPSQVSNVSHDGSCCKRVSHEHLISVNDFSLEHLPPSFHQDELYKFIKCISDLTVLVSAKYISKCRPKAFSEYSYFSKMQSEILRKGTGIVYDFTKYYGAKQSSTYRPCPCRKCKIVTSPNAPWVEVLIMTSSHLIFDEWEAKDATCSVFFDEEDNQQNVLDVLELMEYNIDYGNCILRCATCDSDILKKLDLAWHTFNDQMKIIFEKFKHVPDKLAIIVSHIHGGPKKISWGRIIECMTKEKIWCKYTYTTPTCSGSTGAYVHVLGSNGRVWHYPHLHKGLNEYGVCESNTGFLLQ